jgi:hypothetical protein
MFYTIMPEDVKHLVSFRLSAEEDKESEKIASLARSHAIRNDSRATLANTCLLARINESKQIGFTQEARGNK